MQSVNTAAAELEEVNKNTKLERNEHYFEVFGLLIREGYEENV